MAVAGARAPPPPQRPLPLAAPRVGRAEERGRVGGVGGLPRAPSAPIGRAAGTTWRGAQPPR